MYRDCFGDDLKGMNKGDDGPGLVPLPHGKSPAKKRIKAKRQSEAIEKKAIDTKTRLVVMRSQRPLAHLAGGRRRRVLERAHRTWLGRVYRSRGRRRGAIAHRVVRQRLGRPPAGEQRPTKSATVCLTPLVRRFRVRLEKFLVLLFLAQIEDVIG